MEYIDWLIFSRKVRKEKRRDGRGGKGRAGKKYGKVKWSFLCVVGYIKSFRYRFYPYECYHAVYMLQEGVLVALLSQSKSVEG